MVESFVNEVYNGVGNWVTDGLALSSMADDTYASFTWAGEKIVSGMELSPENSYQLGVNYNKGGSYSPDRDSEITSGKWGYMYYKIRAANQFFNNIDNVQGDADVVDRLKGEIYFLRAHYYAQLINVFGEVPIITDEFELDDDFSAVSKSSFQEVTDFIISDCDKAIALLPISSSDAPGRATKGAAMALKAEQLLYAASPLMNGGSYDMDKLEKAKVANEAILDLNIYSLYRPDDYRDIFLDKDNSEIIFARYTNGDLKIDRDNTMERDIAPAGTGGYTAYCPLQGLVDEFEVIDGNSSFIPATWSGTQRTVTDNPQYNDNDPYLNRDPRFYASILYNGASRGTNGYIVDSWAGGKDSRQSTTSAWWNASYTSYYLRKFSNEAKDAYDGTNPQTDIMWIHYRLGEVYLNMAEILVELNSTDSQGRSATWYANEIRERAGMPLYSSVNREEIRHERRVELVFEGNRFFDVRRWEIYGDVMSRGQYGLALEKQSDDSYITSIVGIINTEGDFDSRIYWWPIPQKEIEKSPSLGQSKGW